MTSIYQNTLAIPENTVQGSGGYTVPANKYAKLSASVYQSSSAGQANSSVLRVGPWSSETGNEILGGNSYSNTVNNRCDLVAGDVITVVSSYPNIQGNSSWGNSSVGNVITRDFNTRLLINANNWLYILHRFFRTGRNASTLQTSTFCAANGTGGTQWTVAEFPIPKNNLPDELIEGN